jgi:hypothetical protein
MEEYDRVNIIPVLVGGCLSVRQQHMTNISTATLVKIESDLAKEPIIITLAKIAIPLWFR